MINDIKLAKYNYYFHVFNMHKNNMKQTWRTITEILNKQVNNREIPTKIIYNDESLTNNKEIACCCNSYFANIGVQLSCSFHSKNQIEYNHLKRTWVMIMLIQILVSILLQ